MPPSSRFTCDAGLSTRAGGRAVLAFDVRRRKIRGRCAARSAKAPRWRHGASARADVAVVVGPGRQRFSSSTPQLPARHERVDEYVIDSTRHSQGCRRRRTRSSKAPCRAHDVLQKVGCTPCKPRAGAASFWSRPQVLIRPSASIA